LKLKDREEQPPRELMEEAEVVAPGEPFSLKLPAYELRVDSEHQEEAAAQVVVVATLLVKGKMEHPVPKGEPRRSAEKAPPAQAPAQAEAAAMLEAAPVKPVRGRWDKQRAAEAVEASVASD